MSEQFETTARRRHAVRGVLVAACLAAVAAVVVPSGAAQAGETAPGYQIPLYADSAPRASSSVVADSTPSARAGRAATITVTYTGFTTAAKAAFQRAVNVWKTKITSSVPIRITARYANLGSPNLLGSAGPLTVHRNFPNAPKQNVWYVSSAASKRAGSDLNGSTADIQANFNSAFSNWHFGTGAPPSNKYDFETVVLHEIGHGLGFLSGIYQSGSTIRWDIISGQPYPLVTGTYVQTQGGTNLTSLANGSTALKNAATSNAVFFNGPQAKAANGGARPRMYAPNPFQSGSSLSHWNEATYGRGHPQSLMTPQLGLGERILNPGSFTIGALKDSGW